jgi:amino-acid N-acetyltransferase
MGTGHDSEAPVERLQVDSARPEDGAALRLLVAACGLPLHGLDAHLGSALVTRDEGRVVGCVALEHYGEEALLRSLAVAESWRGRRLGERLTEAALVRARAAGARRVWLLTTTADRFFPRFGFERVERAALPEALGASAELRGAGPASAVAMRLELDA